MKCFVTGATGFVGGHLVERLLIDGHKVAALARHKSGAEALRAKGCVVLKGSLDSLEIFERVAEEVDVVFHLAAITKTCRASDFDRVNVGGCQTLADGLRKGGFRGRLVYLSSLAAGGPALADRQPRRESDPDEPVSAYGRSKLAGEAVLREGAWSLISLRPGAIYGPREHEILEILKVMARAGVAVQFGEGITVQMTHVADVVDALVLAMQAPEKVTGQHFYITDSAEWSFGDVVRLASEALDRRVRIIRLPTAAARVLATLFDGAGLLARKPLSPLNRDKVHELRAAAWLADSRLAESVLGWRPTIAFPDGLRESITWYRENKWL